ncbi:ATP-binding cassette domain-containing protein [Mucilaginibacter aquatilis]|uniref:ATP-binding cassette domain-containing protein n=1 Tax=Mucilaginibacter aquatilis TaxID=1517760 RepID=A0A6I4I757_9SPHI|nr:ATP-binding cassette domain-containing protein [Mucilaginibacter aquatilis]MVN91055.1 ATP-binding cassette domain-containing protein [Mucilaginibacter aquatilis]
MLKVDSVLLEFDNRKILQDIYIDCRPGEVTGLLGRNGCGKSSLLRIIFGVLKPAYKYINIDGNYINNGYSSGKIAYLPQHNYLPKHIKISELAKSLISNEDWDEFTAYDTFQEISNKKPGELSGGQLRKLETLIILYSKADYILLDEPFTHISPIQAEEIKAIIKKRSAFKGIIITDHQYRNILKVSDKIVLLSNGTTKVITSNDELVTYGYLSSL